MAVHLLDFQQEDFMKLKDQRSVLIANEMGTGKTYEAIALDLHKRNEQVLKGIEADGGRTDTLVVAPLTVLQDVWDFHYDTLTTLPVTVVAPKARDGSFMDFLVMGPGVFCVHWEALRLMEPALTKHPWLHIIADECHRAKNRTAQQTKALKKIEAPYKTALSGTPVVNRPDELWSILNWLYPLRYKSYWNFYKRYVDYTVENNRGRRYYKILGPKNSEQLLREIEPFYVRHLKKDVLKDLPDKYYTTIHVDLDPHQRKIYDMMRKDMIAWIGDQEEDLIAAPVVVAQLTRLQQFSCAYAGINPEGKVQLREPSSKIDALMEVLSDSDQQVVVFSRFKQLVKLVERRLSAAGISWVSLTGDTPQDERARNVRRFQAGKVRVFVGSIAAGGIGITLHSASTVVFLDRDWSPALNSQAEDRLHRYGQTQAVQVIDIIARDTVDLGRMTKLEQKKSWIRQILGDKE